jgi:hypothetical protein
MNSSVGLVTQFDQLALPLTISGPDLHSSVERLVDVAQLAVATLVGWSLTVPDAGCAHTLTSMEPWVHSRDIRASLRLPLAAFQPDESSGALVFYATAPHAFAHLAVQLVPGSGVSGCRPRIDQDLNPNLSAAHARSAGASRAEQAVGVTIGRPFASSADVRRAMAGQLVHRAGAAAANLLIALRPQSLETSEPGH